VSQMSRHQGRSHIVIPPGAAFGTGQHPTTAMSLRLLEQITGSWEAGWSMVDLGTGSGIFALAAKRFGAERVIGIDIDPTAISTSKANARLNGIGRVDFRLADVLGWRPPTGINLVTANLFSELLIAALPKLRRIPWLILSGLVRDQERQIRRALKQNCFRAVTFRRRGKWIAILARKT
jgi:ribosomal protein L11 methyltransferase